MAVSAVSAVRAWINADKTLVGPARPLRHGAHLEGDAFRSPAHGAYALLVRAPGQAITGVVAEDNNPSVARVTAQVYAGTIQAAEAAAVALANRFQQLNGSPEPCGSTGVTVLVADNFADPSYVPMPGGGGEQHCYTTSADFMLLAP